MPRGQRDYGMYGSETYVGSLADMAELAARLGSIVLFDRRGKVIDLDDCETPFLKWTPTDVGNGAVALDNTYPKSGSQCIKLTSGDGRNDHGTISKGFMPLSSKRLGLEFIFSQPSTNVYLQLKMIYFDGAKVYRAGLRLDFNGEAIGYQTGELDWTDIIEVKTFDTSAFFYYPIKFVVDFPTGRYVRLMYGGREYDLSAYTIWSDDDILTPPHLRFVIACLWRAGAGSDIYIDDIIFTEDEP